MSETSQGEGWWRASDGKWYPPTVGTGATPPPTLRMEPPGAGEPQKRRAWKTWHVVAIGITAFIIGAAVGAGGSKKGSDTAAPATTRATPAPTLARTTLAPTTVVPTTVVPTTAAPTTVPGPKTTFGDGEYRVGSDIAAGTYRASGTGECYWARLKGFSGDLDDILANNAGRPGIVTIAASDAGFKTEGCGTWSKS